MKNIKNIFRFLSLALAAGLGMTSCDLDMLPLNDVVLENFWTNKDDVEKVLTSCYVGMQEEGWVQKAIIWGEVRSDNIAVREGANNANKTPQDYINIIKGNLKQNNPACQWGAFYRVINYCNTLLYYAPKVAEKDPNLTPGILAEVEAQAKAIRALNYFYLVRTFKDVPFTLEPSIDDTQDYTLPATKGELIVDELINDLELCKNQARRRYTKYSENSGRITRNAIYALLADLYLWKASDANLDPTSQRAAYEKCLECCQYIFDYKINEYNTDADGLGLQTACDKNIFDSYGYPLLREDGSVGTMTARAYSQIFGQGNSFESIFELTYGDLDTDIKNTDVSYMYNGENADKQRVVYLGAPTSLLGSRPSTGTFTHSTSAKAPLFTTYYDYRTVTSFYYDQSSTSFFEIMKYVQPTCMGFTIGESWSAMPKGLVSYRPYTSAHENWIIYRLTDVMLMAAEAQVQLAKLAYPEWNIDSPLTTDDDGYDNWKVADDYLHSAMKIVQAVYQRSNPNMRTTPTAGPSFETTNKLHNIEEMETLVEAERRREFLFEGKRYFDLVRRARREGNTKHIGEVIREKFDDAPQAFLVKMAQMDFMYMPYAESELKANPNLSQNPVYAEEETTIKN